MKPKDISALSPEGRRVLDAMLRVFFRKGPSPGMTEDEWVTASTELLQNGLAVIEQDGDNFRLVPVEMARQNRH